MFLWCIFPPSGGLGTFCNWLCHWIKRHQQQADSIWWARVANHVQAKGRNSPIPGSSDPPCFVSQKKSGPFLSVSSGWRGRLYLPIVPPLTVMLFLWCFSHHLGDWEPSGTGYATGLSNANNRPLSVWWAHVANRVQANGHIPGYSNPPSLSRRRNLVHFPQFLLWGQASSYYLLLLPSVLLFLWCIFPPSRGLGILWN